MVDLTDAGLDVLVRLAGEMWYDDGEDVREAVPALVAEIRAARAAEDVARRIAYAEKARADRAEEDVLALRAQIAELIANGVSVHKSYAKGRAEGRAAALDADDAAEEARAEAWGDDG